MLVTTNPKKSETEAPRQWHEIFAMITRGFVEEFSLQLSRNGWVLYLALATFYNPRQERAFPTLEMLYATVPLSRSAKCKALSELVKLELLEVWGSKRGRRRRTYYRLLHVDGRNRHVQERKQPTYGELLRRHKNGELPTAYDWFHRDYLKCTPAEQPPMML